MLLPGKFHGQRRLVDYSPWGHKESDMTERLNVRTLTHTQSINNIPKSIYKVSILVTVFSRKII